MMQQCYSGPFISKIVAVTVAVSSLYDDRAVTASVAGEDHWKFELLDGLVETILHVSDIEDLDEASLVQIVDVKFRPIYQAWEIACRSF